MSFQVANIIVLFIVVARIVIDIHNDKSTR